MNSERLLHAMANEIPTIINQVQSSDPVLQAAGLMRLMDFARMLQPYRGRVLSRRDFVRTVGATFAALSLKADDD